MFREGRGLHHQQDGLIGGARAGFRTSTEATPTRTSAAAFPAATTNAAAPSLADTTAQRKPGPVLGHLAHGAASVTALQAEGHHPCAPRGQPPPTPTPTRGPLCFSVTWSKKNPTLTCSPCCPSSVRVGAGVLSWALGTGAH